QRQQQKVEEDAGERKRQRDGQGVGQGQGRGGKARTVRDLCSALTKAKGTGGTPGAEARTATAGTATATASPPTRRRRAPVLMPTKGIVVVKAMKITDLALAELMQYKEYAYNKARELGLEPGDAVDATVLEGRAYSHLDAMRYRLNLLQTLVCATSHSIIPEQAEGLWLALVERALSDAELDLSFEALLGLGREAPQGLPTLAATFFERMCCQDSAAAPAPALTASRRGENGRRPAEGFRGGDSGGGVALASEPGAPVAMVVEGDASGGSRSGIGGGREEAAATMCSNGSSSSRGGDRADVRSNAAAAAAASAPAPTASAQPAAAIASTPATAAIQQRRRFDLHKLRPSGFRFFICCLEVTNLAIARLRPRGAATGVGSSTGDSSPDNPGPMPGPMSRLEVEGGADLGGGVVKGGGSGCGLPSYVVVSRDLLGLETLWSIALEVEEEEVSEAAIKKLCELCLHVEVSDELPAEAVARERASFVSRCTERLARAADALRGDGPSVGGGGASCTGGEGGGGDQGTARDAEAQRRRKTAVVSATRSLQLLLAYLEEAGGRMRAQGLSVHSHCGSQLLLEESAAAAARSGTITVRVRSNGGKATELQAFPGQTVQAFRLAVASRLGGEWTPSTTRLLYSGREMKANDSTLEEQGVLDGSMLHAARRLMPKMDDQTAGNTPPRATLTVRVKPPQPDVGKTAAAPRQISQRQRQEQLSTPTGRNRGAPANASPGTPEQRGRKRAASCDAADPVTRKGLAAGAAPERAWTGDDGAGGSSGGGGGG
ncbi:unnamed protein product, partial [Scytosiphon promiscuus]